MVQEIKATRGKKQQYSQELRGKVIAVQANYYQVLLEQEFEVSRKHLLCTRRSRLKKIGQKVMVGDHVIVAEADYIDSRGVIAEVLPRTNELERPPVANAEQILLIFALEQPKLDPNQLSRFLVKAESTNLNICLCLNKADLVSVAAQQKWQNRLEKWGYQPVFTSLVTQQGLEELVEKLQQQISIVAGPSGVGKSSLINQLIPDLQLRIGAVSGKLHRGRHTTRHVELFELPKGGWLADTPGFNQPDIHCQPQDLIQYFPEARVKLKHSCCHFSNCLHRDEPNCAVRGDWERYEHYLRFLDQVIVQKKLQQQKPDQESNVKLKIGRSGEQSYEPRLESKKYRRLSRRFRHQTVQEFDLEEEE